MMKSLGEERENGDEDGTRTRTRDATSVDEDDETWRDANCKRKVSHEHG